MLSKRKIGVGAFVLGCAGAFFLLACPQPLEALAIAAEGTSKGITRTPQSIDPAQFIASSQALLERGRTVFLRQCAPCHGADGKGEGPAAYLLYPKPRDLTIGVYRFASTWDGAPLDEDLFRTISRGISGSAMPSWAHLPERDRWGLVHYVKSLASDPIVIPAAKDPNPEEGIDGEGVVRVTPEPKNDAGSLAQGRALFLTTCSPCHGERGLGDGKNAADLRDSAGYPIRPRDLSTGVFKGSPRPDHLFRRIVTGIPGTPMPASPSLLGDDAWHLVHYVLSLSSEELRDRAEMKRFHIEAGRTKQIPDHPDSGRWNDAPSVNLHLMPLWWRYNRPEYVTVKALHDGDELAILMVWADDTHDQLAIRPQDFRDGAAIQFALSEDAPFFAMGEREKKVNIWMWKSERQADLTMFGDVDAQYPNIGIDSYPNLEKAPYEQPQRRALTLDSDQAFVTAWGAGNIVADPTRKSAVEDLSAQGFGTLRARKPGQQAVRSTGIYGTGSYRVVFRRKLKANGDDAVSLEPGRTVPIAFAIWNGSFGDRDGKKSVTIWQDLAILP